MSHTAADAQIMNEAMAISLAGTSGIDHVGLTIRDLDLAINEVRDLLGGGLCYIEGPIIESEAGWMTRKLGAADGSYTLRVAAMNISGINLELFEYRDDSKPRHTRAISHLEYMALLVQTPNLDTFVDLLPTSCRMSKLGEQGYEVELESGLRLIIQGGGDRQVWPVFGLGALCHDRMISELSLRFGMMGSARVQTPKGEGIVFSAKAGASIVILRSAELEGRPANSDLGGHHIGFHADDVDAAAFALSSAGYQPFGRPETIIEGPIAGDTWVYLASPFGFQLELINMPDGELPYESTSKVHRNPIRCEG